MLKLRHPISLMLIALLILLGVLRTFSTPAPVGGDAPDVVFSADRADAILRDLLADGLPHVSGSAENRVVRDRIIAHLQGAGYEPEIQSAYHCNPMFGGCSPVENVVAVKPGADGQRAILLTAHYDSAWAGPGAADDAAGTAAILEIARMAADFPAFDNDVIFLLSDAEEGGLIGADAFAEHHPLFARVKAVIGLEARGVSGPSVMFETGEGNRSVIRMLSKYVDRPVANSLTYEVYKRIPNETDFSVYKRRGVTGVNFAFVQGVALYHSALDDPDHLELGSLQHHGDNAWGILKALGERNLSSIRHAEDAGYVDVFGLRLVHYPISIAGGLSLFLGVWAMIAIGLAFRKEFRYRQLRWGFLAIPLLFGTLVLGGYLLSWPLGRWPELHPLEHPYPWIGRLTLFLLLGLLIYAALKIFAGRVSACAWMVLAWAIVFLAGLVLTSKLPSASYITLLPLSMFALGSIIDLMRKKSPAPLLMASVLGFAAAAFISFYHFFMLDVALNFDRSAVKVTPLFLLAITAMPMLLAFVKGRELTWQPARWLLVAILSGCFVHLFLPGFTAERPRAMSLMYSETEGAERGYIVLESIYGLPDRAYARSHDFRFRELNDGRLGTVARPVREVAALGLPAVDIAVGRARPEDRAWRRELVFDIGEGQRLLQVTVPPEVGLQKAWVNGSLALDTSIETKYGRSISTLSLKYPVPGPLQIELLTQSPAGFTAAAVTWHDLPGVLSAPFLGNWPDNAQPAFAGPRAEKIQEFAVPAAQ
jgi:hypothetical protein